MEVKLASGVNIAVVSAKPLLSRYYVAISHVLNALIEMQNFQFVTSLWNIQGARRFVPWTFHTDSICTLFWLICTLILFDLYPSPGRFIPGS